MALNGDLRKIASFYQRVGRRSLKLRNRCQEGDTPEVTVEIRRLPNNPLMVKWRYYNRYLRLCYRAVPMGVAPGQVHNLILDFQNG